MPVTFEYADPGTNKVIKNVIWSQPWPSTAIIPDGVREISSFRPFMGYSGDPPYVSSIVVPSTLEKINHNFFSNLRTSSIQGFSSLSYVGHGAFLGAKVSTLNLGNSTISFIGSAAFYNIGRDSDNSFISLNIAPSTTISTFAFYGLGMRSTIFNGLINTIPSTVQRIQTNAFSYGVLSSLRINGYPEIEKDAFAFNSVTSFSIDFPSTASTFVAGLFSMPNLRVLTINGQMNTTPSFITAIPELAFNSCGLSTMNIQGKVTHISTLAFRNTNFNTLNINFAPEKSSIDAQAFIDCSVSSLTINNYKPNTIPSTISVLGAHAFHRARLQYIDVEGPIISTGWSVFDRITTSSININFHQDYSTLQAGLFRFTPNLSTLTINGRINTIPSSITNFVIDPLRDIGLTYLTIEGPISHSGRGAMYFLGESRRLSTLIVNYASTQTDTTLYEFSGCPVLSTLIINGVQNTMPSSFTFVDSNIINGTSLTFFNINGTLNNFFHPPDNPPGFPNSELSSVSFNLSPSVNSAEGRYLPLAKKLSTMIINGKENELPESITAIEYMTFSGGLALKNLILPSTITRIEPECFISTPGPLNTIKNTLPTIHKNPKLVNSLLVYFNLQEKQYNNSTFILSNRVVENNKEGQALFAIQNILDTQDYNTTLVSTNSAKINSFSSITTEYSTVIVSLETEQAGNIFNLNMAINKYGDDFAKLQAQTANNFQSSLYDKVLFSLSKNITAPLTIVHKDDQNVNTKIGEVEINKLYNEISPNNYVFSTMNFGNGITLDLEGITSTEYRLKYIGPFSETLFTTGTFFDAPLAPPALGEVVISNSDSICDQGPYNATNFTPANSVIYSTLQSYAHTQPQYPWDTGSDAQQIYRSQQNISYFVNMNNRTAAAKVAGNNVIGGPTYPQFRTQTERLMYLQGMTLTAARNKMSNTNPSGPAGVPCSTIYQIINS
jgi:hypothetical protein